MTGRDIRTPIDAVLAGEPPSADQMPGVGCNIEWIAGRKPSFVAGA